MDANKPKGRNPELLVDRNGVAAQVFTLGGETISVTDRSFDSLSSYIRVHNPAETKATLKLSTLASDVLGTSIGVGQTELFGCDVGDRFAVTGTLEITFVRDRG